MNNIFPVHIPIISKEIGNVNLHRDFYFAHNRDMENLAERLANIRREKKFTQKELAKKAGLKNQSIIGNLENGHRKSSSYIPAIAQALGVEPLWLSEGKLPKFKEKQTLNFDESVLKLLGISSNEAALDILVDLQEFVKLPPDKRALVLSAAKEEHSSGSEETGEGK